MIRKMLVCPFCDIGVLDVVNEPDDRKHFECSNCGIEIHFKDWEMQTLWTSGVEQK